MFDEEDCKKSVAPGHSSASEAEVIQMPIKLTPALVEKFFGKKKDGQGLPRFRLPGDDESRVAVWSRMIPIIYGWLEAGGSVTYFSEETRFLFSRDI